MRCVSALLRTLALSSLLLGCSNIFISALRVSIADYDLLGSQRVDRVHFDFTYRAHCVNDGPPADAVVAVLQSRSPATTVVEGTLRCGPVGTRASVPSLDTFTIRQDRRIPFDPSALVWIVATIGNAESRETDDGPTRIQREYRVSVTNRTADPDVARVLLSSARNTVIVTDDRADVILKPGITTLTSDLVEVVYERGTPFDAAALSLTLQLGLGNIEAVALVQTLDGVGHPLTGVQIDELGPNGSHTFVGDAESGVATLGQGGGDILWKFSKPGFLPVWRKQTVSAGKVSLVPSPRLAQRASEGTPLSPLNDALVSDPGNRLRIAFAAGAFPDGGETKLTPLDGQSLPAFLPAGWSPLTAFWLELPSAPAGPAGAEIDLDDGIAASDHAALVRFDSDTMQWQVLETLQGDGSAHVTATIPGAGAFAVVVADVGAGSPATPVASQPLPAGTAALPDPATLQAEGSVTPAVSPASPIAQEVTGVADVRLTSPSLIPSGFVLEAVLADSYTMADGRTLSLPGYSSFLVAYRRPGAGDEKQASLRFPLRPRLLFAGDVLTEAHVRAQVRAVSDFSGGVLSARGGTLSAAGIEVLAEAGDLEGTRPARLDALDANGFAALLPTGAQAALAFELTLDGVSNGRRLRASFAPQAPNAAFVLARAVSGGGQNGLEPVERLASDAAGILASLEPAAEPRLPGIVRGGRYVLVRVGVRPGIVLATARAGSGESTPIGVSLESQPWLSIGAAGGTFRLVAPPGDVTGIARELASGDEGRAGGSLADAAAVLTLELVTRPTGPRAVSVEPEDGARGVGTVTPVRIRFSEPLAPGSFGPDGLVLRDASGVRIEGALSLDLSRTSATLLPKNPLAQRTAHTLELATTIRDLQDLALEGEHSFEFTTASPAARGIGAELVIYEPGAQTAACDDVPGVESRSPLVVCATGSQGTADPDVAVVLVNEASGVTSTVRSREDGSFEGFVDAAVDDLVSATFVNSNGTRVQLPVTRQLFDDGSVGLFSAGGTISAELPTGEAEVVVEPGAIAGRTKLRLRSIPPEIQQQVIGDTPPAIGTLLGQGLVLEASGDPLRVAPDVRISVDEAALVAQGFDPSKPEEATFALVQPREVDGVVGYQILDKLEYEDGKLVSHSPPFPGPNPSSPDGPGTATDICQQNAGALAVLDELNRSLELTLLLLDPSGLSFVTEKIMFWPLTMAIRARPVLFTGKVEELLPGEIGCNVRARPLPGAMVTVRTLTGPGQLSPPRVGRLDPGDTFAIADARGKYAALLPRVASDEPHAVTGQHPRHVGLRIVEPANEFVFPDPFGFLLSPNDIPNPVSETDLLFPSPLGNTTEQPAQVTVAHVPLLPAPNSVAQVKVFGVHGLGAPTVTLTLKDVKPLGSGATPSLSDVSIQATGQQPVGATGIRQSFDVLSSVPAFVVLEATASVPGSNPTKVEYAVEFGGEPPPPAGGLPVSDPNDRVPPVAINTWPADGAVGFTPGLPIEVNFSEPVKRDFLGSGTAVNLSGPGLTADPTLDLSSDQMRLTVQSGELLPGELYTLTLTSGIEDLAGNRFDGDPATEAADSLSIQFRTSPIVTGTLPLDSGASAVLQGIYAFALDRRGTTDGALVVFDMSDPDAPQEKARFNLPAFPRDLALIPEYSSVHRPGEAPQKRTLVAVVGGLVGGSTGSQAEFTGGGQYLIVVDVTNPLSPSRFASALLTLGPSVLVPRVLWSPPFLGYIESGADLQSVGVINLQTFALGTNATQAQFQQFPVNGTPGSDANGDGDFTDAGEELPLPCRCPGEISGKVLGFTLGNTTQKINDLAVDGASGYFAAAVSGGALRDSNGQPTGAQIAPAYRTFFKSGPVPVPQGDFSFAAGSDPKRVRFFAGVPILVNDVPTPTDLALVSVNAPASGVGKVVVLDVTDPFQPKQLNTIDIDPSHGLVQSIELRDDGLLVLATSSDLLLFDPARLVVPQPPGEPHPGIVATIPNAGSGQRTFMSLAAGLQVVNLGSRAQVVQTAPLLSFVRAPKLPPFDPKSLAGNETLRDQVLADLEVVGAVFPSRVVAEAGVPSDVDPPSPATHYYVRIDAPGSADAKIPVALESLDLGGQPLRNQGLLYAPVRAMSPTGETQIGETPQVPCDAQTAPLEAHRLSSDPADPDYNAYLAGPFVLVIEEMSKDLLDVVRGSTPERTVLWSGFTLRATIDPSVPLSNPVGPFASEPDFARKQLKPGAGAFAFTFPGDYLLGPNPEPVVGGAAVPGSYGSVQAHSGEVRLSDLDLELDGRAIGIAWTRTYGAQDLFDGPLGRGWDFYYNQRLRELAPESFGFGSIPLVDRGSPATSEVARGNDVVFYDGEGAAVLFRNAGNSPPPEARADPLVQTLGWLNTDRVRSYYLPQRGVFELLFKFQDGRFARLTRDGRQFWYEPDGRLATIYDRYDKNVIKLRYNRRGQLVKILDELDRALDVGWYRPAIDPAMGPFDVASSDPKKIGHIARLHDYSERNVYYDYDANGLLERRKGPTVTQAALGGFTGDDEITYLYSDCSDPEESANAIQGTVEGGAAGAPIVSATGYSAGTRDQVSALSTAAGSVGFSMSRSNEAKSLAGNLSTFKGPDGLSIEYLFNGLGQPEQVRQGGSSGRTFQQRFNADGLLEEVTFPEGNGVEYIYDGANLALRARANLVETRRKAGPGSGDPDYTSLSPHDARFNLPSGTQTDFAGNSYDITLEPLGRDPERIEYPNNDEEKFQYNTFGQLEIHTSADGVGTTTVYDGDGWPETETSGTLPAEKFTYGGLAGRRGLASRVTDPKGIKTDLVWNERDQLIRSTRAGRLDEWGYDATGRQEAQATRVEPAGVVLPGGSGGLGRTLVERRHFDPSGFMDRVEVESVEVEGNIQNLEFRLFPGAAKRIERIEFPSGEVKRFFYDGLGQIEHVTIGDHAEFYTYDDNGEVESRRIGNAVDSYVLDGHRRMQEWRHPGGGKTTLTYDGNDAVRTERVEDPIFGVLSDREFAYDVRGRQRLTRVGLGQGGTSDTTLAFDTNQRSITRSEANGAQTVTTWDDAGRVAKVTTPYGTRTETLDPNGNPQQTDSVESGRTYTAFAGFDDLDHLISQGDGVGPVATFEPRLDGAVGKTIDAAGRVLVRTLSLLGEPLSIEKPNGVRESRQYDARRRLTRISDAASHTSTIGFDLSLRMQDTIMPGNLSTVFSSFDAQGHPQRVHLANTIQVDHVNDVRGRPKTTTYGGFQGLPIRQENFSYDALDRVRTLAYPGGRQEIDYDGLATIREVRTDLAGVSLAVKQTPDASGYRQLLEYPSLAVQEVRDPGGRLEELRPQGATPVVSSTSFIAADVIGERALGAGAVRFQTDVDGRKRPRFRRYENASGDVLLDLRYTFDAVDDLVSRQRIDRGGRSDLFRYDEGHRLTRADHGARPSILGQGVRAFAGFQVSPALPGGWAPGLYARETSFDDMDVFTGASTVAPQAVPVPPFAGSYGAVDASLHVGLIDGLSRQRDALGNTGNALLQTRDGAAPAPVATEASLLHDQKSRLVKISRADGAQVENEFDAWGLRTRRTVTCGAAAPGCQPSDRFYLYHKGLLLEEYEGGAGTASLLARYFYDDESDLLAMDRRVAGGGLERFYFLTDIDGSVLGVADAGGRLLERVLYDAWGEPTLELADGASPRVRRITAGPSGDLLVEWTERVLPPIDPGTDPGAPETRYADLASAIVLRSTATGNAVPYSVEYAEAESGFALGTVLRIRPSSPAPSELLLEIAAGAVRDEWNNPVAAVSIPVRSDLAPGTPAFSNPDQGSTAPERVGRSSIGSPFLFHGEYFDYETGLVYLRNRFYQPSTGLFLERDPMPYADSVNAYAGMMNNPVAFKDPSGAGVFDVLKVAGRATARAASAGARAAGRSIRSVGRAAGNLGRGFGRKATALVNRLDRSANRLTAQLDEALNGSYKAAAQTTRRVDSVGPRARQLAADFRAARATSTPEPTAGVQAGTGGRAVALDGPTAQRPPTTLAARSEDFAPLPRPLSQKEVASIQAKNAAFNASNAGQRVLHQAKINRANRAIELHPELEGINPKGCKTNCVASENALGIRKSEGLRSVNADDVETPLKNGDNAFNPRETQFHEFLNVRDVVSRVKAAGPGAHFHVRGIRGQGIVGHRFGVVNHNGAVHFLDPQLESFANLKGQGYVSFWLLRYK